MLQVFDKFIDKVVSNLQKRFPHIEQLEAFSIFCPDSLPHDIAEREEYGRPELQVNQCPLLIVSDLSGDIIKAIQLW